MTMTATGMMRKMKASTLRAVRAETAHLSLTTTLQTQEAYEEAVRWIETFPLTQFFTLEFGKPTGEALAVRRILQWHDALEWLNKCAIGVVFGLEMEPSLHAHGVFIGGPHLWAAGAEYLWGDMAGDARVNRYEPHRDGVAYVLKQAYWTHQWDFEHLKFYSPHVHQRRSRLTREFFYRSHGVSVPATS